MAATRSATAHLPVTPSTLQGKRARTREQLLDAALSMVAGKGLQAVSILALAQAAGVSNGTFYNYFRSREALLEAVALRMAENLATALRPLLSDTAHPAARVALATGCFMSKAREDKDFGWALLRLIGTSGATTEGANEGRNEGTSGRMSGLIRQYILTDLREGARLGCFSYVSEAAALDLLLGTLLAGIRSVLEGEAGPMHAAHVAEVTLRGLGVKAAQARKFSALALS